MVEARAAVREPVAGRYRLLEVVHRGTNHVCWHAEDIAAERPRLLTQILLPDGTGPDSAHRITARVLRTSETMGLLRPGRVAGVVDAVAEAGTLWTVTEWIDGTPLSELLAEEGPFHPVRAARIALGVLDVLDAAHAEGITHGELGPGQVYVQQQGGVVLTGFGLAGATLAPRITAPSYASPEQARDGRIGPAADLWALGALLYTMVEGRPPFRDRGRPEATLKGVDRLPLRTPLRAGPLTRAVQGLLRKNSLERLSRPVVRDVLARVLSEDPGTSTGDVSRPRLRGAYTGAGRPRLRGADTAGRARGGRAVAAGAALAVVSVAVAVLAVTHRLPGTARSVAGPPAATAPLPAGGRTGGTPPGQPTSGTVSPSATATGVPAGYRRYDAPEGFSIDLPAGWSRLRTLRASGPAYRVVFGASGDARTLAVTHSERVGPDAVAVWRDDVEPGLERQAGYRRVGDIRATVYQGYRAADMEWLSGTGDRRVHTFGRGLLVGGHRGFSLRWTAPAGTFGTDANQQILAVFLRTFRPASG